MKVSNLASGVERVVRSLVKATGIHGSEVTIRRTTHERAGSSRGPKGHVNGWGWRERFASAAHLFVEFDRDLGVLDTDHGVVELCMMAAAVSIRLSMT